MCLNGGYIGYLLVSQVALDNQHFVAKQNIELNGPLGRLDGGASIEWAPIGRKKRAARPNQNTSEWKP